MFCYKKLSEFCMQKETKGELTRVYLPQVMHERH